MVCKCCCLAQGNYSLAVLCFHFLLRTRTQVDTDTNDTSISPYHNQENKFILEGASQLRSSSHNRDEKNELTKGRCLWNTTRSILYRAVISQLPITHRTKHFCWKAPSQAGAAQLSPPCYFINCMQSKGNLCPFSRVSLAPAEPSPSQSHICQLQPPCRKHN